jgi:hypothetical protein
MGIGHCRETRYEGSFLRQGNIEHHRARTREAVDVSFKLLVQDDIASLDLESAMIASFFIATRDDDGGIGLVMAGEVEDRGADCLPRLQETDLSSL